MSGTTAVKKAAWLLGTHADLIALYDRFPFFMIKGAFSHTVVDHVHEFLEIDIVMGGGGWNVSYGERYALTHHDLVLGNQVDPHAIIPDRRISMLSIKFRPSILPHPVAEKKSPALLMPFIANTPAFRARLPLAAHDRTAIVRIAEVMSGEYSARGMLWQESVSSLLEGILIILYRSFAAYSASANIPLHSGDHALVERLAGHIDAQYTGELHIGEMLKEFGVSASAAAAVFKRTTGSSLKEYLIERRITAARRMLAITDEPILDICFAAGFTNLSNFNRIFKQRTSVSPREYRERQRTRIAEKEHTKK